MITFKTIRLIHLLSYLLVTSQLLFYLVIFCDAIKQTSIENFMEHRKGVEQVIDPRLKMIYYSCLALSIAAILTSMKKPSSVFFITAAIALICLLVDMLIAIKGNIPLNNMIREGVLQQHMNWESVRTQWLNFIRVRGVFITIGMTSLLVGLIVDSMVND